MKSIPPFKIFIYSIWVEIIAIIVATSFAGAGHGSYATARILFPFTMISTVLHENIRSEYVMLGLFQYPAYGFILSIMPNRIMLKLASSILILLHAYAVYYVFVNHNEYFPNTI